MTRRSCASARQAIPIAAAVFLALSGPVQASPQLVENPARFQRPDRTYAPESFWWWPGAAVTTDELRREIADMASAGWGGAQVVPIPIGVPPGGPPSLNGWGTPEWTARLKDALEAARDHGLRLDFSPQPGWPFVSPAVAGAKADMSQQELVYGRTAVAGGTAYAGPVPPPKPTLGPADNTYPFTLVAVTAAKIDTAASAPSNQTVMLEASSAVDVTDRVSAGNQIQWMAPSGGNWLLFGFWRRATGQKGSTPGTSEPALVVDHFSREAAAAATAYLDSNVFREEIRPLLGPAASDLSLDSLEIEAELLWTKDLLEEFEARRRYSLVPYLPVLFVPGQHRFLLSLFTGASPPEYEFAGGDGQRVRRDYYETLSDLYVEEHLEVMQRWSHSRGLTLEAQPAYGSTLDAGRAAAALDVPGTESLAGGGNVDFHRVLAGGAHMGGAQKLTIECCATLQGDYGQALQEFKRILDLAFAGGITQVKVHGYPYADAPGAVWPGWSPMSSQYPTVDTYYNTIAFSNVLTLLGFGESWGDRQPMWRHWRSMSDYIARTSQVLQEGRPRVDVAIYRQEYTLSSAEPGFPAKNLGEAGFTYEYVDPHSLTADTVTVDDGQLAPTLAGYRAVVLNERAIPPKVAARLAEFAHDGLAVVIVGRRPDQAPGFRGPESDDRRVKQSIERLLAAPRVRRVDSAGDVRSALARLDIEPDVAYSGGAPLSAVHRQTEGADYWYLLNRSDAPVRVTASFAANGQPHDLDPWIGKIEQLAVYRPRAGRVELPIALEPHGTRLIGFSRQAKKRKVHVVATAADGAAYRGNAIVIRDYQGGERSALLSDGTRTRLALPLVPEPLELKRWRLFVEDWRPSEVVEHDLELEEPRDWRDISELRGVSGVGTYSTGFELPPDWRSRGFGVELDLGVVAGSVRVTVNGKSAAPQPVAGQPIAIGHMLREGANHITIELATTLRNRLEALARGGDPNYARFLAKNPSTQPYGLLGPVRLVPYAEAVVGRLDDGLGLSPTRRCVSRRSFWIRLRAPRGQRLRSARVYVNGKRVRVLEGKRLRARVNLRGLPRGRVRVRIVATTTRGHRIVATRRYRTCVSKRARQRGSGRRPGRRP